MNKIPAGQKKRRDHHARLKKYIDFVSYPETLSNDRTLRGLQPVNQKGYIAEKLCRFRYIS